VRALIYFTVQYLDLVQFAAEQGRMKLTGRYHKGIGVVYRYLHMVSGIALFLYLLLNAVLLFLLVKGEHSFQTILSLLHSPFALVAVSLLLLVTLFHVFNGVRILFFDLGLWIEDQKDIALTVLIIVVILFIIHFLPMVEQVVGKILF